MLIHCVEIAFGEVAAPVFAALGGSDARTFAQALLVLTHEAGAGASSRMRARFPCGKVVANYNKI